ncbi:aconitase X, partial [Pseudomonas aeruginosa]|uniref:aconitase X n=1 Tax=Pseudomonas aeruginosa TaxID=287 RepID=UPI0020C8C3DA
MSQINRLSSGGRIDRNRPLTFSFNGQHYQGYAGDTLAAALLANGVDIVGRSFKYSRARGIVAAGAEEPNAILQIGSREATQIPNVRATQQALYGGLVATSTNGWPNVQNDLMGIFGKVGGKLMPPGFYYKTFMYPQSMWMTYEKYIRKAAGLGRAPTEVDPDSYDWMNHHCDVLVVGGGPAGLRFAETLRDLGARVRVPTTLNAISVDQRRWREQGVPAALGEPAAALAQAYLDMGAQPSFTCAPYLLDDSARAGEQIVWAESNAVLFANSVLGARTNKYADFMDICCALTGRAPLAGCHLDEQRQARVLIEVEDLGSVDDAFYPTLGYLCGLLCDGQIPAIDGLRQRQPDRNALKAFGAALGTSSSVPMFHVIGVTPEAPDLASAFGGRAPR